MAEGFTWVFSGDRLYTIGSESWGSRKIGDMMANGHVLTPEVFNDLENKATKIGTFDLD